MSISGIQGLLLEVTVVACNKLKDTEWFSRQDPYVCVEYASSKFRTQTCTDGGKNPTFQEKFVFTLIEGLREMNVVVWNSNTITNDDFIGSGKVQLHKVLSQGYDDTAWTIQTKTGRYAGEVRLILHYANANKPAKIHAPSAPPYITPSPAPRYITPSPAPQASLYSTPPPVSAASYPQHSAYPAPSPSPYPSYPSNFGGYPPASYPPPQPAAYPPPPFPPTSAYPPSPYPPPPQASPYYPPGPFPGLYPPPPY